MQTFRESFLENTERLRKVVGNDEQEDFDLAEAALLIAKDEYPALDVAAYMGQLDQLAADLRARLPRKPNVEDRLVALNALLFDELGFEGNTADYYDPRNSFLNEVLDRRTGIPITLCIVYMEVGRRIGLDLHGIAFPWHFLVKIPTAAGDVVLDPFSGGVVLSEEDLVERLKEITEAQGVSLSALARTLIAHPSSNRQIIARVLRNLKTIYMQRRDHVKALAVVERLVLLTPEAADEVRDRAMLHERCECFGSALEGYRHYLNLVPAAPDRLDIARRMLELEKRAARLN